MADSGYHIMVDSHRDHSIYCKPKLGAQESACEEGDIKQMRIILASASPRRKELLKQIGFDFEVITSHVEEKVTSLNPDRVVEELSRQKAEAVRELFSPCNEEMMIIGADTVVSLDGCILGKPSGSEEAEEMLKRLQGRRHEVYTGVTVLHHGKETADWTVKCFHESTAVQFYPMTEQEILEYIRTGDPLDKAGAYGIQGFCARYIKAVEGNYDNVVGLPVGVLYQEIKEFFIS